MDLVAYLLLILMLLGGTVSGAPLLAEARAQFDAGHYAESAEILRRYLDEVPEDGDARVLLGWCQYRQGEFIAAASTFSAALERVPVLDDARVGLGYSALQSGRFDASVEQFRVVLKHLPQHRDALRGLVLVALRDGSGRFLEEAASAASKLLAVDPSDRDAARLLLRYDAARGGTGERRLRAAADPSRGLRVPARAGRDYLEVHRDDGTWEAVFVKGFNLGAALPGRFPTEFPTEEATYAGWLDTMADLGANTVRVYTLLPPEFYRALAHRNARPGARRLWLIHGVWTELPPGHDFSDPRFLAGFQAEISRVIDAVHGNLLLAPRPGHASGLYDTDASSSVLAFVIGREWEPFAVKDYNALRAGETSWKGKWLRVSDARAMECWVARVCDFAAGYEAEQYGVLHPLTFANWPTLDPLTHPTESTRSEEDAWKRRRGIPYHEKLAEAPWEDDAVSLDATRIRPTDAMKAGFFAAYHIYPNFPDFINLEPAYGDARDAVGPSRYAGYLRELKAYHGTQPVLVAEFGISTSRGIAHVQPQGWHHGGHDETEQGELVGRMLRCIADERYAGGIVFSFLDEWFKKTWSTAPLEVPADRRRLWYNAESPEESYGILAARPASASIRVDGDPGEWSGVEPLASSAQGPGGWADLRELRVTSDEGYVYILLRTGGGPDPPDWRHVGYRLAIDTYDRERGERVLPPPGMTTLPTGVEFLVDLWGPGQSRATVSAPYEPYSRIERGPIASPVASSGRFVPLDFEANRPRFGRDGTAFAAVRVDRGSLRFGSLDPAAPKETADTRTDVSIGPSTGTLEIRLPWALLNVTDPSSRRVLHQEDSHPQPLGTVESEGMGIYALSVNPASPDRAALDSLPEIGEPAPIFRWANWEQPGYALELKRGAALIRVAMQSRPDRVPVSAGSAASAPHVD